MSKSFVIEYAKHLFRDKDLLGFTEEEIVKECFAVRQEALVSKNNFEGNEYQFIFEKYDWWNQHYYDLIKRRLFEKKPNAPVIRTLSEPLETGTAPVPEIVDWVIEAGRSSVGKIKEHFNKNHEEFLLK